jgi:hypothetical protein
MQCCDISGGVAHGGDGGLGDDDDPVVVSDSESPVHRAPPRHEDPFLPDGINIEEARMLEAAMLGTAYEGRMPDFANPMPPSDAPTDPAIVEERFLREEQDAAYQASLAVSLLPQPLISSTSAVLLPNWCLPPYYQ